ncbi:MAG: serine hydrolase [Chloroflexota bacterium]|nr:serine hydrolase [Chloroflexota bacterium]
MAFEKTQATLSRRSALRAGSAGAAVALGATLLAPGARGQVATPVADEAMDGLSAAILEAFKGLPGQQGLMFLAPPDAGRPAWSLELNADDRFFIASVFKALALAECLRQEEAQIDPTSDVPLAAQLNRRLAQQLPLDESVFSLAAPVLNSPSLTGTVTLRTALEAMIAHSDNTATDIVLKHVGPENVTAFIAEIGLTQTEIPLSTHQFFGYVFGVEDWEGTTWEQLQNPDLSLPPRPILNDTITMASTPREMVSFYSRALQGEFFQYAATLEAFRQILAIGDAVLRSMPLGVNGFGKGGSIDFGGSHVLTFAGGLYVPDRWVYFALFSNWTDEDGGDSGAVQGSYLTAAQMIFTLIRDRLSR